MANGNGTKSFWAFALESAGKHGPWMVGCFAMGWVMMEFALKPSLTREAKYADTICETAKQNAITAEANSKAVIAVEKHTSSVENSMNAIAESTTRQEVTLDSIDHEIEKQSALRLQALASMNAFADKVTEDHPRMEKKIDEIKEAVGNP